MARKQSDKSTAPASKGGVRARRAGTHNLSLLGIQAGDQIVTTDAYCLKLEGERGAGKTTFALEEVVNAARKYGEERVLCCMIDMDNGARMVFGREDIVPAEYRKCFLRKVIDNFEDVYVYLEVFTDLIAKHAHDYPTDSARYLVLENEGAFWLSCRDHYAEEVHGMPERELMKARMAQARAETKYNPSTGKMEAKKMLPTYAEGRRAAYAVINRNYLDFFTHAMRLTDEFNCNFIYTTLAMKKIVFQDNQATDKMVLETQGRPDKSDGYPDFILQFYTEKVQGDEKFMLRCTKNRAGPRFKMDNHGPDAFWRFIKVSLKKEVTRKIKIKEKLAKKKKSKTSKKSKSDDIEF